MTATRLFIPAAVVSRQNGTVYTSIFTSGQLMFDDIDMMDMLQIVARVVGDSLGNFARTPRQRDERPAAGLTLDVLPGGEDYLLRPVDAGMCSFEALRMGASICSTSR